MVPERFPAFHQTTEFALEVEGCGVVIVVRVPTATLHFKHIVELGQGGALGDAWHVNGAVVRDLDEQPFPRVAIACAVDVDAIADH